MRDLRLTRAHVAPHQADHSDVHPDQRHEGDHVPLEHDRDGFGDFETDRVEREYQKVECRQVQEELHAPGKPKRMSLRMTSLSNLSAFATANSSRFLRMKNPHTSTPSPHDLPNSVPYAEPAMPSGGTPNLPNTRIQFATIFALIAVNE